MKYNLILLLSLIFFILFTSCGILYIVDNRLNNIKINVPKQNINVKINKNTPINEKFTPKTKPMNFDNRPLINPVSEHEIPKIQPTKKYNTTDIPKCSC